MGRRCLLVLVAAIGLLVGAAGCDGRTLEQEPTAAPAPTRLGPVRPANPEEPVLMEEIEGQGTMVTRVFNWPGCGKTVFHYTVEPGAGDRASLTLDLHPFPGGDATTLVTLDVAASEVVTGSASWSLPRTGGRYFLSASDTEAPWTVRVECQEHVPPVGREIEIAGRGNFVSANYELPRCWRQVYTFSAEPDQTGTVTLRVDQCGTGGGCKKIIDVSQTGVTETVTDTALGIPYRGTYFFAVTKAGARAWTLSWEPQGWYSYERRDSR